MRDAEIKHSRTADGSYHAEYEAKMAESVQAVDGSISAPRPLLQGEQELGHLAKVDSGWAAHRKASEQVVTSGRAGQQTDAADVSDGAASMAIDDALHPLGEFGSHVFDGARAAMAHSDTAF
jgi:hypothetical protein